VQENKGRKQDEGQSEPEALSFEASAPCSDAENRYDAHCEKWGTKWDANEVDLSYDENDTEASYSFDTAWGPPNKWLASVALIYPELHLELQYEEPGCDFAGIDTYEGGEMVTSEEYTYRER